MGLSRRDLLAKCVSLGVVSLATNLSANAAAEAWSQSEKKSRPSTPAAETGPFYKRNAPNTAMMRASNDPGLPLTIRLLSLFHVVTPPLLLWAIRRLGYDRRGWKLQTLMAWIVVPINYFWRPEQDVNWARGPFFHEQHVIPGWAYLVAYLTVVPLFVYFPTHLFLAWVMRRLKRPTNATT